MSKSAHPNSTNRIASATMSWPSSPSSPSFAFFVFFGHLQLQQQHRFARKDKYCELILSKKEVTMKIKFSIPLFVVSLAFLRSVAADDEPVCFICGDNTMMPGNMDEEYATSGRTCADLHHLGLQGFLSQDQCEGIKTYLAHPTITNCNCIERKIPIVIPESYITKGSTDGTGYGETATKEVEVHPDDFDYYFQEEDEDDSGPSPMTSAVRTIVSLSSLVVASYFW